MSVAINIKVSGDALELIPRIKDKRGLMAAISRALYKENNLTVRHIQEKYLSFPRQEPTTLEGLRTFGGYRNRLVTFPPSITASGLQSSIGTNIVSKGGVSYPAVHEFGAIIPPRATRSKNKIYARKHPTTKGFTLPARAPIQRGIKDRLDATGQAIGNAIIAFWKGENPA